MHCQYCHNPCACAFYGCWHGIKEIKMTRQEAIDKFKTASGVQYGAPIVDTLEALGLIKFDKEEYGNSPIDLIGRAAVSLLEANGYTIIRSKP